MTVLLAEGVTIRIGGNVLIQNLHLQIKTGEHWAITGPSGSGKTTLLKTIYGTLHHTGNLQLFEEENRRLKRVVLVEQQHHFKTRSNTANFYYQQRFNSCDADDANTVSEDLTITARVKNTLPAPYFELAEKFGLQHLLHERLVMLSNGENKKLQLVKALHPQPALLLLDNPFTGLDALSRQQLEELLSQLTQAGTHIVITTTAWRIPTFVTHVLALQSNGAYTIHANSADDKIKRLFQKNVQVPLAKERLGQLTGGPTLQHFEYAVRMNNVTITYDHTIINNLSWQVKRGERWALSGPNGSGKSTLISLINADNPQAYANDIYLFDKKRGTGETIWDIKKYTGYVSPELHLYFEKTLTCFEVVASGLFDTIGLFRKLNDVQRQQVAGWMELLHVGTLQKRLFWQASHSEQRLVLLTRALVKNPPLLLLDEPCQGLDEEQTARFIHIIDEICTLLNKTLIYVSHHAEEIPACVTKYIKLENGKRIV